MQIKIQNYLNGMDEPDNKALKDLLEKGKEEQTIKPNRAQRRAAKKKRGR